MIKNENFEEAQIVLLPFPFSDLSSVKTRPALIIKNLGSDLIVVAISSKSGEKNYEKISNEDLSLGELPVDSYVRYAKIITIDSNLVNRSVGQIKMICFEKERNKLLDLLGK